MRLRTARACVTGLALATLAAAHAALAQTPVPTPAEVPPPAELSPPRVEAERAPDAAPSRPALPELAKPEDDLRLDVQAYTVDDDAPAALRAALPALTARFTGSARSFEDLANAVAEVTRFLQRDLGYYLGFAYLPQQDPGDGVVRIAVLEGRIDEVVLNWRDGLQVDRDVVEAYLARLRPGSVLLERDLERVVFLLNDLRGLRARFEVRAGRQPGTAALVVEVEPETRWSARAEVDANGARSLGRYRLGVLGQLNSPLGRGDGLTGTVLASNTGGLAFALLGYNTPIGSNGLKAGLSWSAVRYQLDRDAFPLDLNGTAQNLNVYGLYPLVRSRNLNLFALASTEYKAYEDRNLVSRSRKDISGAALGLTGDFRDSVLGGGVNTFELNLAGGSVRYRAGSARPVEDDQNFLKLGYGFTRLQDVITGRLLAYVAVRGQYANANLDTTEQFRLGGPEAVRGFSSGVGTGDIGTVVSLEARVLPPEAWFGRSAREWVASAFFDAGYVQFRYRPGPAVVGPASTNSATLTAAGLGLSWERPGGLALRLSVARALSGRDREVETADKLRINLRLSYAFN
jgi:hemolysin activation/secretion protein